jgi:hypothetical protein
LALPVEKEPSVQPRTAIAAAAAAVVVAAPQAAAQTPRPVSVSRTVTVAGAASAVELPCPRGTLAAAGAVAALGDGVAERASMPSPGGWTFRFAALPTGSDRSARVVLRCLGLRPPRRGSVRLNVATSTVPEFIMRPHASRRVRIGCIRGYIATGWGLEHGGQLRVAAAVPGERIWTIRVENASATQVRATLRARCVQAAHVTRVRGKRLRHRFAVRRREFSDSVEARTVTHSCARDEFSLMTGASAPGGVSLLAGFPTGARGGSWTFANPTGAPARVRTYLLCLERRTGFISRKQPARPAARGFASRKQPARPDARGFA